MSGRRWPSLLTVPLIALVAMGASGAAGAASKPSTPASTLTVLPVGTCQSTTARGGHQPVWVPTELPATVTASAAKKLEFYSVGSESVLGPRGWDCAQLFATDGSAQLAVTPPRRLSPFFTPSRPGMQLVLAKFDYTGHVPGYDLACPFFPAIKDESETCPSSVPSGEMVKHLTPDVVQITDSAKLKGSLTGSGGSQSVTGVMIVPQSSTLTTLPIAEISCSLKATSLCTSILNDFVVRQFPVPMGGTSLPS
jgi:hypothetical protein